MVDIKQLKYFLRIVEFGNMTRASESLHIAQPALSQQLANLEADLNTRLLERSVRGMTVTPAGQVLYRHAKSLLKQLEDARYAVQRETQAPSGRVSIGIPGSSGKILVVPLLQDVAAHAGILLEIVERPSAELVDLVVQSKLDLAVVVDAQSRRGVTVKPVMYEELCAIFPREGRSHDRPAKLTEIAAAPLILPSPPSTIRQRIDAAFLSAHLGYRLTCEISATDLLVRAVAAGLGWTVLPRTAVMDEVRLGLVGAASIAGSPLHRELSLCVSDALPLSTAAEVVYQSLVRLFESLVTSKKWNGGIMAKGLRSAHKAGK